MIAKRMFLDKILFFFVFFKFSFLLQAQIATIEGCNLQYADSRISFYTISNPFFNEETLVASSVADKKGCFVVQIACKKVMPVYAHLGIFKLLLYVEPDCHYIISLPAKKDKSPADWLNPFFLETTVIPQIKIQKSGNAIVDSALCLSNLISAFDDVYDSIQFKIGNTIKRAYTAKQFDSLTVAFKSFLNLNKTEFYRNYIFSSINLLRMHAMKYTQRRQIAEFYTNYNPNLVNPAELELFNHVFNRFFINISAIDSTKDIALIINRDSSLSKLNNFLLQKFQLKNDTLRELVILKGCYDAFYSAGFVRSKILCLIDSVRITSKIAENSAIATGLRKQLLKLYPGSFAPDFTLKDDKGKLVSLSEFKGKYLYLNFCNSDSYVCLKDFIVLNEYVEKFKQYLNVISVFLQDDYEQMKIFK